MKSTIRLVSLAVMIMSLVTLTGCGVSKEKYETLLNDKIALEEKAAVLIKAKEALKNEYDNLLKEKMDIATKLETMNNEKAAMKGEYDKILDEKITIKAAYDKLLAGNKDLQDKLAKR